MFFKARWKGNVMGKICECRWSLQRNFYCQFFHLAPKFRETSWLIHWYSSQKWIVLRVFLQLSTAGDESSMFFGEYIRQPTNHSNSSRLITKLFKLPLSYRPGPKRVQSKFHFILNGFPNQQKRHGRFRRTRKVNKQPLRHTTKHQRKKRFRCVLKNRIHKFLMIRFLMFLSLFFFFAFRILFRFRILHENLDWNFRRRCTFETVKWTLFLLLHVRGFFYFTNSFFSCGWFSMASRDYNWPFFTRFLSFNSLHKWQWNFFEFFWLSH